MGGGLASAGMGARRLGWRWSTALTPPLAGAGGGSWAVAPWRSQGDSVDASWEIVGCGAPGGWLRVASWSMAMIGGIVMGVSYPGRCVWPSWGILRVFVVFTLKCTGDPN